MLPTLEQAIQAIKAGDKAKGRQLLANIIQADYNNELAWLWMSSVADSDEQRWKYLEQVLKINPDNKAAQKGLALLNQKLAEQKKQAEVPAAEPASSGRSLGARLAARTKVKEPEQPQPAPVKTAAPPEPPASQPAPSPPPDQPPPVEPLPEPAPVEPLPEPEPQPLEPEAAESRISEIREQFAEPSKLPPALRGLEQLWRTEQGKWVIGGGLVAVLFACLGCAVCGLILQLPGQDSSTPVATAEIPTVTATLILLAPTETPTSGPSPTPTVTPTPTATNTPVVPPTATVTPTLTRTPTPNRNLQTAQVIAVIEGDIIDVILGNQIYRVKYLLINAPALNDPELGTEPFGSEAFELNRRLVEGQTVTLEKDVSDTDASGRLLRYVYVGDLMINEELLRQGLARTELIPPDLKHGARLQEVELAAQAANTGIWSLE